MPLRIKRRITRSNLTAALLSALILFSLALARPAAAWEQVCLHMPLGPTWFVGRFYLAHGFNPFLAHTEGLPMKYVGEDGDHEYLPRHADINIDGRPLSFSSRTVADELLESSALGAGRRFCFSVRHVPEGEPLFAYVATQTEAADVVACKTPPGDSSVWFVQTPVNQTPRKLWLRAWGSNFKLWCEYNHESD